MLHMCGLVDMYEYVPTRFGANLRLLADTYQSPRTRLAWASCVAGRHCRQRQSQCWRCCACTASLDRIASFRSRRAQPRLISTIIEYAILARSWFLVGKCALRIIGSCAVSSDRMLVHDSCVLVYGLECEARWSPADAARRPSERARGRTICR